MSFANKKVSMMMISAFAALILSACGTSVGPSNTQGAAATENRDSFSSSGISSSSNSDVRNTTQMENNSNNNHSATSAAEGTNAAAANTVTQSQQPSETVSATTRSSTAVSPSTTSKTISSRSTGKQTISVPAVTTRPASTTQRTTAATSPSSSAESADRGQAILRLVNQERAKKGLSALILDNTVSQAAQIRAYEIIVNFSHTRPDGTSCFTALDEVGIVSSKVRRAENIASGQRSPEEVMKSWMNSDGHRANILNPNMKKLGVGYAEGGPYRTNWVQMFTS